jgi:phosphate transport system permease protein
MRELAALRARSNWRTTKNMIATWALGASVVVVAVPRAVVFASVLGRGLHVLLAEFPDFLTLAIEARDTHAGGGMGPAIVGTLLVTVGATLIAVPLGVLAAVYLHEYGGVSRFARIVRFMAVVMTGVPSIVMGLFVYLVWTIPFHLSAFGGALALACLMLPVIIGSSEQMLRLVGGGLREAALALGATKSRTILTVALPAALPGIVSGALLAIARAAGETAPILFTVGAATSFNTHLFSEANTALPLQIYGNAASPYVTAQDRAWGAALVLVLLTFAMTFAARAFTARFATKR